MPMVQVVRMTGEAERRLDTLQAMELAEGVEIRLRIAGPFPRGGALLLDLLIQAGLMLGFGFLVGLLNLAIPGMAIDGVSMIFWFGVSWWYPVFFEAGKWGATPGKKICGLRVVQKSGSPITWGQSVLRNFLRYADGMPYLFGGIAGVPTFGFALVSMMATRRFQRLGDLAAGTVVIYDRQPSGPMGGGLPVAEVRAPAVALRPEEVRALTAFKDRLATWSPGRQVEIADHVSELSGAKGAAGVSRLLAMAKWLQERN
ncbi:putative RDD family membrane protein YckC [Haloferula luteola]|uniref:Putative RDD family membrane protein YckC n=1 Tax=Haloferula luteola TaxID=595692 RepID=A0A840UY16_9BACT|nr:RDD family protein [Haloferula luteola]MBB5350625.1 putative RDD family membrane protein YckC [Haloferula luteola]